MNFVEGFRRIGIVILVIALCFGGTFALIFRKPVFGIVIAGCVVLLGNVFLCAAEYVAKGFMKKTTPGKGKDQAS